jgi:hypothetical protein
LPMEQPEIANPKAATIPKPSARRAPPVKPEIRITCFPNSY